MSCYLLLIMDPEDKIPEIPYYTPERTGDPPGGISFYTLQIPLHKGCEESGQGWQYYWCWIFNRTKQGISFDSKLFDCLQYPLINKTLSTNHLLSIFINYLLKELASVTDSMLNPSLLTEGETKIIKIKG